MTAVNIGGNGSGKRKCAPLRINCRLMAGGLYRRLRTDKLHRHVWRCDGARKEVASICTPFQRCDWLLPRWCAVRAGFGLSVTGWCHQMANRILRPAGVDVSAARGHGLLTISGVSMDAMPCPTIRGRNLDHCSKPEATAGLHEEVRTPFLPGPKPRGGPLPSVPGRLDRLIDEHLGADYASDKRARLRQLAAAVEPEPVALVQAAFQSKQMPHSPTEIGAVVSMSKDDVSYEHERRSLAALGRTDYRELL